jgi:hypothetical protein
MNAIVTEANIAELLNEFKPKLHKNGKKSLWIQFGGDFIDHSIIPLGENHTKFHNQLTKSGII